MKQFTKIVMIVMSVLFYLQLGKAIDVNGLFHNPDDIFYVNPSANEIRLKTSRVNVIEATVVLGSQHIKMEKAHYDENFDYFSADVGAFDTTSTYYFVVKDKSDSLKFPLSGEYTAKVPLFITPSWAAGKIYYSIFPDGFYNGNHENDPEETLDWGKKPDKWQSYGGDLKGIIKKIAYIDSLDPDIIILQPIFTALSNHKLNPKSYATIDPAFGDTLDLKILVNELHKRNKKIILSVIFTHTGIDFPAFVDIREKSALSKYINWYLIGSMPLQMSPPNYESWRSDPHFPKLNLHTSQVKNYLIGYLEYWRHFGFDGFYIGEDKTIDFDFSKALRSHLKSKHPDILLLGSGTQPLTGEDFDGCRNRQLTELLINYFVKNTIITTEFDNKIRELLFFNPPQANCINLINLSDYDTRIHQIAKGNIVKNLYAFIFTFCGSPVILYGDEIGMSACTPLNWGSFSWNPQEQNRTIFEEIRKLMAIRKTNPQISTKYFFTLYANDITKVYAYDRGGLIVILNSGEAESFVKIPAWDGVYFDLVNGDKFTVKSQTLKLSVHPKSYRILRREI